MSVDAKTSRQLMRFLVYDKEFKRTWGDGGTRTPAMWGGDAWTILHAMGDYPEFWIDDVSKFLSILPCRTCSDSGLVMWKQLLLQTRTERNAVGKARTRRQEYLHDLVYQLHNLVNQKTGKPQFPEYQRKPMGYYVNHSTELRDALTRFTRNMAALAQSASQTASEHRRARLGHNLLVTVYPRKFLVPLSTTNTPARRSNQRRI